jgi:ribosome-associated toxin RatA of RatAB toxin-antitoxin module
MQTSIEHRVRADPQIAFGLAGRVEDWPRILPHYRWVRVLEHLPDGARRVEMAARRDVLPVSRLGVPLRWTAIQRLDAAEPRIEFEHVAGITRGMQVAWTFQPLPNGALKIQIHHAFHPRWPVPDALVHLIVGEYFVNGVARRTLQRVGDLAEARSRALAH